MGIDASFFQHKLTQGRAVHANITCVHVSQLCALARVDGEGTGILKVFALPCFADIHYFHCLRIVELLKGTEASTKNIFGRYSSQRMKASVGEGR